MDLTSQPNDTKLNRLLFVYGTLKNGHGNNRRIQSGKLVGEAETIEPYLLMDFGHFPGMYERQNGQRVVLGELWAINDNLMDSCDMLEGHPSMYERKKIKVKLRGHHDYPMKECETYFYQGIIRGIECKDGVWPRKQRIMRKIVY